MTIFVTGAFGFIGSHLVRRLCTRGHDVHALVKPSSNPRRLKDLEGQISIHQVSLTDTRSLAVLLARIKPRAIYHVAAAGAYANQTDYAEMVRVNTMGTLALLEASLEVAYTVMVNIGSSAEYGIKPKPMAEHDLLEPQSVYAATKASGTLLCQVFAKLYDKPIVTIRPFTVYGPHEESFRFIPTVIRSILKGQTIKLTKKPLRHDYVYIDDMVDACILALKSGRSLMGKICNVGTGLEYTNAQVVRMLFRIAGKTVPIEEGSYTPRRWDSPHWVADISQTKRLLGWEAKTSLTQGLRKTYEWMRTQL